MERGADRHRSGRAGEDGGAGQAHQRAADLRRRHPRRRLRGHDGAAPRGQVRAAAVRRARRSEEHTSELQSLMRISYAVFCLKKKNPFRISSRTPTFVITLHAPNMSITQPPKTMYPLPIFQYIGNIN